LLNHQHSKTVQYFGPPGRALKPPPRMLAPSGNHNKVWLISLSSTGKESYIIKKESMKNLYYRTIKIY